MTLSAMALRPPALIHTGARRPGQIPGWQHTTLWFHRTRQAIGPDGKPVDLSAARLKPALRESPPMLQLYGNSRSRAMRCLWMLEEIGQPYQLVEKTTRPDDLQTAEY